MGLRFFCEVYARNLPGACLCVVWLVLIMCWCAFDRVSVHVDLVFC